MEGACIQSICALVVVDCALEGTEMIPLFYRIFFVWNPFFCVLFLFLAFTLFLYMFMLSPSLLHSPFTFPRFPILIWYGTIASCMLLNSNLTIYTPLAVRLSFWFGTSQTICSYLLYPFFLSVQFAVLFFSESVAKQIQRVGFSYSTYMTMRSL